MILIVILFGSSFALSFLNAEHKQLENTLSQIQSSIVEPSLHKSITWYARPDHQLILVYIINGKFYGFPHSIYSIDSIVSPNEVEKIDRDSEWILRSETIQYTIEPGPVEPLRFNQTCNYYDYQNLYCKDKRIN
ncbi:MAG: hypothetical protein GWN56_02640 [Nitrosopumilaceae archaeon]|nr:hypothetical protein [Nitrosopumilaceae archaeon]NIU86219.1 hypothetical protein [Nitrosopumilaceae archaeon]NIV64980.1 hypothetical protein [Nitrosopumilaceae archaeon]